jgi:hypothetical protein
MIKNLDVYKGRISQGDILRDIEIPHSIKEEDGLLVIEKIHFPYSVVITQDCDLDQDNNLRIRDKRIPSETYGCEKEISTTNADKKLLSVIVLPLYNEEHFKIGKHLSELGRDMLSTATMPKDFIKNIKNNKNERYHYLDFGDDSNLPNSIVDFKHYFTVNIEYLYTIRENNWTCKLPELYRELLSQRFANYLSRIGIPS